MAPIDLKSIHAPEHSETGARKVQQAWNDQSLQSAAKLATSLGGSTLSCRRVVWKMPVNTMTAMAPWSARSARLTGPASLNLPSTTFRTSDLCVALLKDQLQPSLRTIRAMMVNLILASKAYCINTILGEIADRRLNASKTSSMSSVQLMGLTSQREAISSKGTDRTRENLKLYQNQQRDT